MTAPRTVLAASMIVCLAACGSADAPPAESGRASASAPVDACTLVAGDEIRHLQRFEQGRHSAVIDSRLLAN